MKIILLKKIGFYFLALSTVVACDKKDNENATPDTTTSASCLLTQVTDDDNDVSKIEYNTAGYVIKLTDSDNDEITTFIYDANNRVIKEENREDGDLEEYTTYEYTNNLISARKSYEGDGTLENTTTYKYDANNRKIEEVNGDYMDAYTYDANGNISENKTYYMKQLVYRQTFENYDDKPTYYSTLKGLSAVYFDSSKNNPGKTTYYADTDGNGTIDASSAQVTNYTYKYNNQGFPTEITETSGNDTDTTKFTYQCN